MAANRVLHEHKAETVTLWAPPLLFLEAINVAARRWRWEEGLIVGLPRRLQLLGLNIAEPDLQAIASWAARGLTAYDATYVALAEARGVPLLTSDRKILGTAPAIARHPARR